MEFVILQPIITYMIKNINIKKQVQVIIDQINQVIKQENNNQKNHALGQIFDFFDIIRLGLEAYMSINNSVSFKEILRISLEERRGKSPRTVNEILNICKRLIKDHPDLENMMIRNMDSEYCKRIIDHTFKTPTQFNKARTILYSLFQCGLRHNWCKSNPIAAIPKRIVIEKEIVPLSWNELTRLMKTSKQKEFRSCMAAVGILLWTGIRPSELTRLKWENIDWNDKVIMLKPRHTKTGGSRHLTMHPVLVEWLKQIKDVKKMTGSICPPNWVNKWRELRKAAGFKTWQQDVLRHTFASYHLKYWKDTDKLQIEMGHSSKQLLKTRYLSMRGITKKTAKWFWTRKKLG